LHELGAHGVAGLKLANDFRFMSGFSSATLNAAAIREARMAAARGSLMSRSLGLMR
jgi:hypothetical protein